MSARGMISVLLLALAVAPPAQSQTLPTCELEAFRNNMACAATTISWVEVRISGDHLAGRKNEYERLVRLRIRNDMSSFRHETLSIMDAFMSAESGDMHTKAYFDCHVWTVGPAEYPIAYYVDCRMAGYGGSSYLHTFSYQLLGIANRSMLNGAVEESLRRCVQEIASSFYDARDRMRSVPRPPAAPTPATGVQRRG